MKVSSILLILLTFLSGCSNSNFKESEDNVAYLSVELDKLLFNSKLKVIEIRNHVAERNWRVNEESIWIRSKEILEETESKLKMLDSLEKSSNITSDFLKDINDFLQIEYNCKPKTKISLNELNDPIDIKFSLISNLEFKTSCLLDSIGSSDVSFSLGSVLLKPLNEKIDSLQELQSKEKDFQENIFIPTTLLNQVSVYPININNSYDEFVKSALIGETSSWLQINEMVNNFPIIHSEGEDLNLTNQLQSCPWNNSNHLLLVNITNNSENDKFIKDLTIVLNSTNVKEFRLLGFENPDKDFAKEFNLSKSIHFGIGESFTMFYEINLNNESAPIGEIMLSFQNDLEGRIIQVSEAINSIEDKTSSQFIFLASVVETALFLNDSKYQSNADLKEVEKRLKNISSSLETDEQKEFIQLLRFFIKVQTEQIL